MFRRCMVLWLLLSLLLTGAVSAQAMGLSNEEKYEAAVEDLLLYLTQPESRVVLEDLSDSFEKLMWYRQSLSFKTYVDCLICLKGEDYDNALAGCEYIAPNEEFGKELAERGLPAMAELKSYIEGCQAVRAKDWMKAADCFSRCMSFMDGTTRYQEAAQMLGAAPAYISAAERREGSNRVLDVKASGKWTAVVDASWVRLSHSSGKGDDTIILEMDENPSVHEVRTAKVTLACGGKRITHTIRQEKAAPELTVQGQGSGNRRPITVESNGRWTATADEPWIHLGQTAGQSGVTQLWVTLDENPSTSWERTGYVVITCETLSKVVEIRQEPARAIVTPAPEPDRIEVKKSGQDDEYVVTVEANGDWTATASVTWIHLSKTSGRSGASYINIVLEKNTDTSAGRKGFVIFECGSKNEVLWFEQEKGVRERDPLFGTMLGDPQTLNLYKTSTHKLFSGPGEKYFRANRGLAEFYARGEVYVWGIENGWYMICYSINQGGYRVGYIKSSEIYLSVNKELKFAFMPAITTTQVAVTDDPDGKQTWIASVGSGKQVYYLATYQGLYEDWYYIECTDSGKPVRGFIPAGTLKKK